MRKLTLLSVVFLTAILISSCAKQVKDDNAGMDNPMVTAANEQLSKHPFTGFAYKSSRIPRNNWNRWAKVAAPIIQDILNKLPDGYAIEVRGHADSSGPEEPEGNKPGNIKISTDRAKAVYNALRKQGITSDKLTYRGVGSAELVSSASGRDGTQRRVTLTVVPK